MVAPSTGSVMLVPFPFSNLSQSKLRPAIVLASADREDWSSAKSPAGRTEIHGHSSCVARISWAAACAFQALRVRQNSSPPTKAFLSLKLGTQPASDRSNARRSDAGDSAKCLIGQVQYRSEMLM